YIVSEAMYALGVPTTRTLCAVRTGEFVQRETLQQGAVSTRIGLAHIRIGTFEYFAAREDLENLRKLTEYSIARLYPEVLKLDVPILEFWKRVARNQMQLVAKWMSLGFIHGVMNTDNMLISGETIDYGPCAFMDNFESQKVFSSIDRNGRYSYSNQPQIALWNLVRLAGCLMPLIDKEQKELQEFFKKEVEAFHQFFLQEHEKMMMAKLGLSQKMEGDKELLTEWLEFLEHNELDFTLSYIDLERILEEKEPFTKLKTVPNFDSFFKKWSHRVKEKRDDAMAQMKRVNPFTIPRNHQVQKVIEFSEKNDDSYFFQMLEAISHPFERREEWGVFQKPPTPEERILKTFCGT
ncbi:MAG: YdiU family protein, partial [Bacteriovoracaceae bacterium]|nr:YdiU family protein [Bacteriovoracaceae bacterium]